MKKIPQEQSEISEPSSFVFFRLWVFRKTHLRFRCRSFAQLSPQGYFHSLSLVPRQENGAPTAVINSYEQNSSFCSPLWLALFSHTFALILLKLASLPSFRFIRVLPPVQSKIASLVSLSLHSQRRISKVCVLATRSSRPASHFATHLCPHFARQVRRTKPRFIRVSAGLLKN